ncbi:Phosphatidylinositol N-acetylglucosaminyltransferase subunit C [Eumeta japonica]|uniref:Phosphatidylinositol N-acetylglucosaminyltransferase subunit C n=1 Tax=Eumeta variegata TaxID=151549 RepID=A0A4C1T099_EUMVA|nr:Phosphatidylinositol N-acetylglucosaminyltransferase subunit C [Eumeta japonica]
MKKNCERARSLLATRRCNGVGMDAKIVSMISTHDNSTYTNKAGEEWGALRLKLQGRNFGLLSFGEEAEEDEGEAVEFRGKPKSTHDLLNDPKLLKKTAAELELEEKVEKNVQSMKEKDIKRMETEAAVSSIRDKLKSKKEKSPDRKQEMQNDTEKAEDSDSSGEYYIGKERDIERRKERDRIRDEIKQLKKEMRGSKQEKATEEKDKSKEKDEKKEHEENELYQKYVEEQEKYRKLKENVPKKGAARSRHSNLNRKMRKKIPWVKNLYGNRDYPDNYTDGKFLEELRKNLYTEKVTLKQAVLGSFRVVNRLCLCILFSILFVYMYNDWMATDVVIYSSITISILGYATYLLYEGFDGFASHFKTVLAYLVIGYLLSPILYTLTDTVSTDTIYALAVIMMCVHLLFFDYGVPAALVSNSLSINAALFGSICLISRLSNPFDAFVLLTVSVLVFVLSPMMFLSISRGTLFPYAFVPIFFSTVLCLSAVSTILLVYFLLLVIIVSVYCPYLFVKWQKYKDNIHGPWDEAIINDSDDLEDCLNS